MATPPDPKDTAANATGRDDADAFAREAERRAPGLVREYWDFVRYDRKWWLIPIVATLLLLGVLVILSNTAAAPFIYALF